MTPERVAFVVDEDHPGTSEAVWAGSDRLGGLAELDLPEVARVLVVAPHPDDEILGAGGLLQVLHGRGVAIEVCAVTDGEQGGPGVGDPAAVRAREAHRALEALGLPAPGCAVRTRLRIPDGGVSRAAGRLEAALAERLGPDTLCVAPWAEDRHPDHEASGRAAARAAAGAGSPLLAYPVWAWHWADPAGDDLPWDAARRLPLTRRQVARKRLAIAAHRSQLAARRPGDPPVLPPPVLAHFRRGFEVYLT